ncbi:MAG: hypothetical protein ACYCUG_14880, partial [Acidimicrobiales bacterium]
PRPTLPNRRWPHSSAARGRYPSSTPSGTSSASVHQPHVDGGGAGPDGAEEGAAEAAAALGVSLEPKRQE